jgi:Ca-activated chloride channel family protein
MIRFANPEYLWLLWVIPVMTLLFLSMLWWRKQALKKWSDAELLRNLIPSKSSVKPVIRFIFLMLASASLILAIARPQIGTKMEEVKRKGSDIMICLDVSNSMNAEDIRPSRLERSKQAIYRLIDKLRGDRIGLIVFAGQAYVQLPITTDYSAARLFLSNVNTDMVPTQGTAIGAAIDLAMESIDDSISKNTSFIIISDGESHEDNPVESARKAAEKGIVIHTIGMGSPDGAPIPVYRNGIRVGFMQDNTGSTIITKMNPAMLSEISDATKGKFVQASNADDGLDIILKEINEMEKKELGTLLYTDYEEQFQYFLLFALLMLLMEFLMNERRSLWIARLKALAEYKKAA